MLNITFNKTEDVLVYVDNYFNLNYDDAWFSDSLVQKMILDIDKSTVLQGTAINSPVLGIISPEKISGGVKALILMLKEDRVVWATACGDNCAKWIIEISRIKDLTICLSHIMEFKEDFEAFCIDTNEQIHSLNDYWGCALKCL